MSDWICVRTTLVRERGQAGNRWIRAVMTGIACAAAHTKGSYRASRSPN